jgi:hypothetical protein
MWAAFCEFLQDGHVATTTEIYGEMCRIPGSVGAQIISSNTSPR